MTNKGCQLFTSLSLILVILIIVSVVSQPKTTQNVAEKGFTLAFTSKQNYHKYTPSYEEFSLRNLSASEQPVTFRKFSQKLILLSDINFPAILSPRSICLATTGSLKDLHHLVELSWLWRASPVTVSIYAQKGEAALMMQYTQYLMECHRGIQKYFVFNILTEADEEFLTNHPDEIFREKFGCEEHREALIYLMSLKQKNLPKDAEVPTNELINIAQQSCSKLLATHVLTLRLGTMPKPTLPDLLRTFLDNIGDQCAKCIYVVPTFVSKETQKVPRSKHSLDSLIASGRIQPLHNETYSNWKRYNGNISIIYQASARLFNAYVAPLGLEKLDIRFTGSDAPNTQLVEAYLSGYQFWALGDAFVLRKSFGHRKSSMADIANLRMSKANIRTQVVFNVDMQAKYGVKSVDWSYDHISAKI